MANKDGAFGFRPVRHLTGGLIRTNEYKIAANYGTSIFQGTPVLAVTAGGIEVADDSSGTPSVILGIFGGCFYTDPTTSKPTFSNYYPASTNASDIVAQVYDDPRIVFEVQHDSQHNTHSHLPEVIITCWTSSHPGHLSAALYQCLRRSKAAAQRIWIL